MPVECKELACQVCSDTGFIDPTAGCTTAQFSDEQPSLSSGVVSWFSSSADFPAGDYKVEYLTGAIKYKVDEDWALNKSAAIGFYVHLNDGTSLVNGPGQDYLTFAAESDLEFHNAGQFVNFHHSGGKIGVSLVDNDYTDNQGGDQSPLFRLWRVCSIEQPPVPPDPPVEETQYLLDSAGFVELFDYPDDSSPRFYSPRNLVDRGLAIWLLTSPTQRQLIHFFAEADFTPGDILDFTAYMAVSPVTDPFGVERTILVTAVGADSSGIWEVPLIMNIESGGAGATPISLTGIVAADAPYNYQFMYIYNLIGPTYTYQNYSEGYVIADYTDIVVTFSLTQDLAPL